LDRAIDRLGSEAMPPCLYSGYCGVAFVANHLYTQWGGEADGDLLDDIDAALLASLTDSNSEPPYELVGGLSGMGIYLLDRLPRPDATRGIEAILDRLETTADTDEEGVRWKTAFGLSSAARTWGWGAVLRLRSCAWLGPAFWDFSLAFGSQESKLHGWTC